MKKLFGLCLLVGILFVGCDDLFDPEQPTTTTTTTTSSTGTLSVSDDYGYLYVGSSYIGKGSAVVTLAVGNYTLYDYSPTTGNLCWQKSIRIDGGKTTTVKDNSYCR